MTWSVMAHFGETTQSLKSSLSRTFSSLLHPGLFAILIFSQFRLLYGIRLFLNIRVSFDF